MGQQLGQNEFLENALKYGFSLWGTAKTGQTTEQRAGDDGDLEKGYPKTGPHFTDNGDGTITDNATGLMWVKDPTLDKKNWVAAVIYCQVFIGSGHRDWRLPNFKELASIADLGRGAPSIDTTFFPNTQNDDYWTSTSYATNVVWKWFIDFVHGFVNIALNTDLKYIRPVRLGVPA